jgi:hypothetical protein
MQRHCGIVGCGSWLRENALTQPATVHDPVNVVRRGRSEHFFLLDDQGPPPSHRGRAIMLLRMAYTVPKKFGR